jgi:phospholipid/cholesterol/gamma-HCH transport system substrate-binding protein
VNTSGALTRVIATAAIAIAILGIAIVLFGGGGGYTVHGRFTSAGQLVTGDLVQVAGRGIGTVDKIKLTDDNLADVTMKITDDGFSPLREGTTATIRQLSLSGVASRYVDLSIPDASHTKEIPDGGVIPTADTTTAVDLDQVFNTLDKPTRNGLRDIIRGFNTFYDGKAKEANRGWLYLNPALAASSRLFQELNADTPRFRRFVTATAQLVTAIAEKRNDLAGLVDNLATTLGATGRNRDALGQAIQRLPGFMRQANTTFVNLRGTLDDLTPLVDESKPVARKLQPFLRELRPLARDARPTLRDLSRLIRTTGADNDLIDLTKRAPAVRDIAVRPVTANGKQREGAFPASVRALNQSSPLLAAARPYAVDLTGWFDDFSHSGAYDALGGASRVGLHLNAFAGVDGQLAPIPLNLRNQVFKAVASTDQRDRCPGSAERGTVWKPTPDFPCDETQVPVGR